MRLIKVGIINTNPTVGAFRSNMDQFCKFALQAAEEKVTVAVGGEALISGYSPEDLLDWQGFTQGQMIQLLEFAEFTERLPFPTVFVVGLFMNLNGDNYNTAAVVCNGHIYGGHFKENLPTYSVFREGRKCTAGQEGAHKVMGHLDEDVFRSLREAKFGDVMFHAPFGAFSVDDCEDLWNPDGPLHRRAYSGSELNCTVNASPFRFGVLDTRREMQATRSADNNIAQVSSYIVGANDGLVFDGGGFVFVNGKPISEAPRWQRKGILHTAVIDLDAVITARNSNTTWRLARNEFLNQHDSTEIVVLDNGPEPNHPEYQIEVPANRSFFLPADTKPTNPVGGYYNEMLQAMVLGTVDYYRKVGIYKCMGNAGSGGTDSAITSIILFRAMEEIAVDEGIRDTQHLAQILKERVTLFSMPSRHNSARTMSLIYGLSQELGVGFQEIPIQDAYERELEALQRMLLPGADVPNITKQNIQVRIRFSRMWNWSNAVSGFFPQNSNMSEKAVGYCTIGGGDIEGHLSLIANVPKSVAKGFLAYLGKKFNLPAAIAIAASKASAELEADQEDEKDLMPFPVLDACLQLFAGDKLMPLDVYIRVRQMFPEYEQDQMKAWVMKFVSLFMRSIYKWVRSPLSLHLGSTDLERERAMELPVVQSMEWLEESLIDITKSEN